MNSELPEEESFEADETETTDVSKRRAVEILRGAPSGYEKEELPKELAVEILKMAFPSWEGRAEKVPASVGFMDAAMAEMEETPFYSTVPATTESTVPATTEPFIGIPTVRIKREGLDTGISLFPLLEKDEEWARVRDWIIRIRSKDQQSRKGKAIERVINYLSEISDKLKKVTAKDAKIQMLMDLTRFIEKNKEIIKKNCPDKLVAILNSI